MLCLFSAIPNGYVLFTEVQFDLAAIAVLPLGTANIDTASTANAVACFEKRFTISKCIGPVIAYE
jgi:hypothetical protein